MTETNRIGLKENWRQFTILVIVNGFIGAMIGMERTILPKFAELEFGVESKTAILSFIAAFGITKALSNYFTGRLANRFGRKNLLLFGWMLAMPIPYILIYAPNWNWIIFANFLLGLSQGLCWSSTVVMKIDLVGEKDRGLAMGLNEFAGYFSLGIVALFTGYIANNFGVRPYPFYLGIIISMTGILLTIFWVKDTSVFIEKEIAMKKSSTLENVFWDTTFRNKTLSSVTFAGLVNNLNDGMIWGLFPILLFSLNFNYENIGIITAIYPTVWGIGQLFTGKMSDHYSKKGMLFWGMLIQGVAIVLIPFSRDFYSMAFISAILGFGTALVYPTFLSTIASNINPNQRAESIGIFRLWRDFGYAIGALISGITADYFGIEYAILLIGGLTILASIQIKFRMKEEVPTLKKCMEVIEVKQVYMYPKKIQIIDLRSEEEYKQWHIPNSLNIKIIELKDKIYQLEKNLQIVTVCSHGGEPSKTGANLLKQHGFNAMWLCGGISQWLKTN